MGFKIDKGKSWKNLGKKTGKGTSDFFTDADGSKEDFFTDADGSKKDFFEGFGDESNYKDNVDPTTWGGAKVKKNKKVKVSSVAATTTDTTNEEDDETNDVEIEHDEDTGNVVISRSKKSKNKSDNSDNMTIVYYSLAGIFILGLGVMMTE
jgi:hypothetical protein